MWLLLAQIFSIIATVLPTLIIAVLLVGDPFTTGLRAKVHHYATRLMSFALTTSVVSSFLSFFAYIHHGKFNH